MRYYSQTASMILNEVRKLSSDELVSFPRLLDD